MQESSPSSALKDPPSSRYRDFALCRRLRKAQYDLFAEMYTIRHNPDNVAFLTLALPILSAVPSDRVAILGVVGLSVYNTIFLTVFAIVLCPSHFWTESLSQYLVKYRKRRGHWQLLSPRRFKQLVKYHRFSIFIHGTDAERPVHLRVTKDTPLYSIGIHLWKEGYLPSDFASSVRPSTRSFSFLSRTMDWDDTVGSHGLAALSRITLSVSLLGANRSSHSLREPSARYKAAVEAEKDQSDDEPAQRKKRKRKTAQPRVAKPANLNVDAEESTSGEDFVVDDDEASSESTDSEVGLTVEGEEAAGVLPSKTNPKSSRTRSKGKEKAAPKKKQKTAAPSDPIQPEAGVSPSEPSAKATRKPPPVKKNAIWNFFEYIPQPDVQNPIKDAKYYKCHLGKALVPITAGANGNVTLEQLSGTTSKPISPTIGACILSGTRRAQQSHLLKTFSSQRASSQ
ncbi:hypothetical protein B0H14DRAFT_3726494 [Mycena olivaceomarginata]|nr:hypothetical protein B0H14DRAFT_3726494 [Mycena olivaceomarginata]